MKKMSPSNLLLLKQVGAGIQLLSPAGRQETYRWRWQYAFEQNAGLLWAKPRSQDVPGRSMGPCWGGGATTTCFLKDLYCKTDDFAPSSC